MVRFSLQGPLTSLPGPGIPSGNGARVSNEEFADTECVSRQKKRIKFWKHGVLLSFKDEDVSLQTSSPIQHPLCRNASAIAQCKGAFVCYYPPFECSSLSGMFHACLLPLYFSTNCQCELVFKWFTRLFLWHSNSQVYQPVVSYSEFRLAAEQSPVTPVPHVTVDGRKFCIVCQTFTFTTFGWMSRVLWNYHLKVSQFDFYAVEIGTVFTQLNATCQTWVCLSRSLRVTCITAASRPFSRMKTVFEVEWFGCFCRVRESWFGELLNSCEWERRCCAAAGDKAKQTFTWYFILSGIWGEGQSLGDLGSTCYTAARPRDWWGWSHNKCSCCCRQTLQEDSWT